MSEETNTTAPKLNKTYPVPEPIRLEVARRLMRCDALEQELRRCRDDLHRLGLDMWALIEEAMPELELGRRHYRVDLEAPLNGAPVLVTVVDTGPMSVTREDLGLEIRARRALLEELEADRERIVEVSTKLSEVRAAVEEKT